MFLSIIIVNYNTAGILKKCIDSFYKFENLNDCEIIIVDNNSQDNSKEEIEKLRGQYYNIRSVLLNQKVSFSAANNIGFKSCSSKYVLLMNPDIILNEPVLSNLLDKFYAAEELGAVSPALIGRDGKFQYDYFQRYPSLIQYLIYYTFLSKIFLKIPWFVNGFVSNHDINSESGKFYFTEQLPCAFFLTKSEILNGAGMMDEKFELFFEDVDLSYTISKKYKLAVDTSAKVTHLGGASIRNDYDWWVYGRTIISMTYFYKKHYGWGKTTLLKFFSVSNSWFSLSIEYLKKIFLRSDTYRIKKHKYFLKLFKENFL